MSRNRVPRYLAELGERIVADGVHAWHGDLLLVADAARADSPAAAAALIDADEPDVARQRALAVASTAVLRNTAASWSLRQALAEDVHPSDRWPVAA
jgi:hypothetical protein